MFQLLYDDFNIFLSCLQCLEMQCQVKYQYDHTLTKLAFEFLNIMLLKHYPCLQPHYYSFSSKTVLLYTTAAIELSSYDHRYSWKQISITSDEMCKFFELLRVEVSKTQWDNTKILLAYTICPLDDFWHPNLIWRFYSSCPNYT